MKKLAYKLLASAGIFTVAIALFSNAAAACSGGAHQEETPDCMR